MSLAEMWKDSPTQLTGKTVQQVLAFAGDGKLKDGNDTSKEFREFLGYVPSSYLVSYASQCIESSFSDSGLALQDVVNQVGRRLGFQVKDGRYRGGSGVIGCDGLWRTKDGEAIVVEVKTTAAYRFSLDTTVGYRKQLIQSGAITEDLSSILYVVGRDNTSDLEAQVRGSRHAWEIRLISIDSLLRLMNLKEELEDPQILAKIRDVLMPKEFTRVDGIIDLVFATTSEVKKEELPDNLDEETKEKKFTPVNFRNECIERISAYLNNSLVRRSPAIYSTPDDSMGVLCANSRSYEMTGGSVYWFAFHPSQKEALSSYPEAYVSFGCGSSEKIILIPLPVFIGWLDMFNKTELEDRFYWHVHLYEEDGKWTMHTKGKNKHLDVTSFYLQLPESQQA